MKPKNPPIIRPGQRKPYVKATRQQIDERRGYVARLLTRAKPRQKSTGQSVSGSTRMAAM